MKATECAGSGGVSSQREFLGDDESFAAYAFDFDGDQRAGLDKFLVQLPAVLWIRDTGEGATGAAGTEKAVRPIPRKQLVPELITLRHLVGEQVRRQ